MHRKKPISETYEMYLKTLYSVRGHHDVARVRDLAGGLGLSPGTVSGVLKKLEALHLVEHERYGLIALTSAGSRVAECVHRRFETLRDVLVEVFGIDPETAAADACMMEHAVSPATANRMRAVLEQARAGKLTIPKRRGRADAVNPCALCETEGFCRAASNDAPDAKA